MTSSQERTPDVAQPFKDDPDRADRFPGWKRKKDGSSQYRVLRLREIISVSECDARE